MNTLMISMFALEESPAQSHATRTAFGAVNRARLGDPRRLADRRDLTLSRSRYYEGKGGR